MRELLYRKDKLRLARKRLGWVKAWEKSIKGFTYRAFDHQPPA